MFVSNEDRRAYNPLPCRMLEVGEAVVPTASRIHNSVIMAETTHIENLLAKLSGRHDLALRGIYRRKVRTHEVRRLAGCAVRV